MDWMEIWLNDQNEYNAVCRLIAKDFCRLYKNSKTHKNIFLQYCNKHNENICFKLFYVDGISADNIADIENIDRRTVFKNIDKESESFGIWLDSTLGLYSVAKQHYKSILQI